MKAGPQKRRERGDARKREIERKEDIHMRQDGVSPLSPQFLELGFPSTQVRKGK